VHAYDASSFYPLYLGCPHQIWIEEGTLLHSFFIFLSILATHRPPAVLQGLTPSGDSSSAGRLDHHRSTPLVIKFFALLFFLETQRFFALPLSLSRMRLFVVSFWYIAVFADDEGAW
jgi:hypothetical protein